MKVKIISFTDKIEQNIAYCARVSNPNNQNNSDFKGLLKYCIKHQHWSVFEHGYITLEIKTSRTIARQLLRHRSFCFQEFSQRYAQVESTEPILYDARLQDTENRQNSLDVMDGITKEWFTCAQLDNWNYSTNLYKKALEKGIAKEQARVLLPEGACPSKLYMTGNVRSWIHFCQLRGGNGTQKETQAVAFQCLKQLEIVCPNIFSLVNIDNNTF